MYTHVYKHKKSTSTHSQRLWDSEAGDWGGVGGSNGITCPYVISMQ